MVDFTDYVACIFGANIGGMSRLHAALNLIAYRMFVDLEY